MVAGINGTAGSEGKQTTAWRGGKAGRGAASGPLRLAPSAWLARLCPLVRLQQPLAGHKQRLEWPCAGGALGVGLEVGNSAGDAHAHVATGHSDLRTGYAWTQLMTADHQAALSDSEQRLVYARPAKKSCRKCIAWLGLSCAWSSIVLVPAPAVGKVHAHSCRNQPSDKGMQDLLTELGSASRHIQHSLCWACAGCEGACAGAEPWTRAARCEGAAGMPGAAAKPCGAAALAA